MFIYQRSWEKIPWDGASQFKYTVWRKAFRQGHVSVGCGEFLKIVYDYGRWHEDTICTTRWNYGEPPITEEEAMAWIDKCNGRFVEFPLKQYEPQDDELFAVAVLRRTATTPYQWFEQENLTFPAVQRINAAAQEQEMSIKIRSELTGQMVAPPRFPPP